MVSQDEAVNPTETSQSGNGQMALFRPEQYKEIGGSGDAFADAVALLKNAGEELTSAGDLGDGFSVVDKGTLVGVEQLCLEWQTALGTYGLMSICRNVTKDGRKVVIVDGSTGLHAQLLDYGNDHGGKPPRHWKHGLRVSEYTYTNDEGREIPAKTYYVDTTG